MKIKIKNKKEKHTQTCGPLYFVIFSTHSPLHTCCPCPTRWWSCYKKKNRVQKCGRAVMICSSSSVLVCCCCFVLLGFWGGFVFLFGWVCFVVVLFCFLIFMCFKCITSLQTARFSILRLIFKATGCLFFPNSQQKILNYYNELLIPY